MLITEVQCDVPELVSECRKILDDLENAESCESKQDFCENIRTALSRLAMLRLEVAKTLKSAEKCSR